jgi:hypothetical protein
MEFLYQFGDQPFKHLEHCCWKGPNTVNKAWYNVLK